MLGLIPLLAVMPSAADPGRPPVTTTELSKCQYNDSEVGRAASDVAGLAVTSSVFLYTHAHKSDQVAYLAECSHAAHTTIEAIYTLLHPTNVNAWTMCVIVQPPHTA